MDEVREADQGPRKAVPYSSGGCAGRCTLPRACHIDNRRIARLAKPRAPPIRRSRPQARSPGLATILQPASRSVSLYADSQGEMAYALAYCHPNPVDRDRRLMPMLFAMPGRRPLPAAIADRRGWPVGVLEVRRFPDEESYLRHSDVAGQDVAIVCTLARPDAQFLSLLFACRLLRESGARSIRLVAPIAYMRRDRRFTTGEALTSKQFAELLSQECDGLITVIHLPPLPEPLRGLHGRRGRSQRLQSSRRMDQRQYRSR